MSLKKETVGECKKIKKNKHLRELWRKLAYPTNIML